MSSIHTRMAGMLLLLSVGALPAAAQERVFPRVPSFELPEASPRVHGLVGRLISARRGDSQFGREAEAEVGLGENFPVLALRRGPRPITLGFGSQVYGRFSLGDAKSAQISASGRFADGKGGAEHRFAGKGWLGNGSDHRTKQSHSLLHGIGKPLL